MANQSIQSDFLVGKNLSAIIDLVTGLGEPNYRAQQLFQWIYQKHVNSFEAMQNIPMDLRNRLEKLASIHPLELAQLNGSLKDGAQKYLFKLQDEYHIEAVLMETHGRLTVCLSTQVGCAVDCQFCATAKMGFKRQLTVGEIVDQFLMIQSGIEDSINNVVFMGMGEPFLNYDRVMLAAQLLNDPDGINLGARKITISTVGIVSKIRQFADENRRYKLAISLNAVTQDQRTKIMPVAQSNTLDELIDSAWYYYNKLRNFLTFEYVLMKGINDTKLDAKKLIHLIAELPCKVNVIPYNEIGDSFKRPSEANIKAFLKGLEPAPFTVTVRWSKGADIQAGCGQLATNSK